MTVRTAASHVLTVPTSVGLARTTTSPARRARATLVVGHGAGGGIEARDLVALASELPSNGVTVVRVEQPWRVAGRKVAVPPTHLDIAWTEVLASVKVEGSLVVGGRSAGARVACRTARSLGADAVVALAFPLHLPGRPERSRVDELVGCARQYVVVQGERDAFGRPEEFPAGVDVRAVADADHGFAVPRSSPVGQDAALARVVAHVRTFLDGVA